MLNFMFLHFNLLHLKVNNLSYWFSSAERGVPHESYGSQRNGEPRSNN